MYPCHLHIHFVGHPCGVFDVIRSAAPPACFTYTFSEGEASDPGAASAADVILVNTEGMAAEEMTSSLGAMARENAHLLALADRAHTAALLASALELEDIWPMPMGDGEAAFRFSRRQKAWETEQELFQVNRANAAKGEFLADMSGELRTHMDAICNKADLLLEEDLSSEGRDRVCAIKSSGAQLLRVLDDILDYSAIQSDKMDMTPVEYQFASLLRDIIAIMEPQLEGRPVRLVTEVQDSIPRTLYGDVDRVKQILVNIMGNAAKFTDEGVVLLRVTWKQTDEDTAQLVVSVIDTGIGIRQENLPRLFDPFEQVDDEKELAARGPGLGLSIARLLVERMNGKVWVESEYGKGSNFSFSITQRVADAAPCEFSKNREQSAERPAARFTAPDARVMVVNRDRANLQVAEELLRQFGIAPELVSSGMDCVSRLWTRHDYDLIFVEHALSDMDGVEAVKLIRSIGDDAAKVPVVALSSGAAGQTERDFHDAGADGFLPKPVSLEAMGAVLERWLPREKLERTAHEGQEGAVPAEPSEPVCTQAE